MAGLSFRSDRTSCCRWACERRLWLPTEHRPGTNECAIFSHLFCCPPRLHRAMEHLGQRADRRLAAHSGQNALPDDGYVRASGTRCCARCRAVSSERGTRRDRLALGDNALTYSVIRQSIDAPLWAADPNYSKRAGQGAAGSAGGGVADNKGDQPEDGALVQFRDDVLWATTNAVRTPIGEFLDVDLDLTTTTRPRPSARAFCNPGNASPRRKFLLRRPIPIVQAIANGSQQDLYNAIRQYIDAPLLGGRRH